LSPMMKHAARTAISIFILFCICIFQTPVQADWINLSGAQNAANIAVIHINDDHVRIELEIFVGDLETFERLLPDEFFSGSGINRPGAAQRLQRFSEKDLLIVADNGLRLRAVLKIIEPRLRMQRPSSIPWKINPYTGQPIPGPPADKRVLYAELIYPFAQKPQALTIIPPLDPDSRISKVPIGFMTYHKRAPLHDFRYLSEPSTVALDWEDPWYSAFDNKALKRWQRGSVMSFLYIEPYEVRHEILARVKDLSAWMDLGLRGDEFIEADENEPLKERVGAFFLKHDRTLIDGKQLRSILDRTAFVKYSMTGSTFLVEPEQLPVSTAMVGVIITYPTRGLPQQVVNHWRLWSDRIQKVPTNAIDPAGPFPSYVTPDDNAFTWNNFLKTYQMPNVVKIDVDASLTTMQLPLASTLCLLALIPLGWHATKRRKSGQASIGLHLALGILLVAGSVALYPFLRIGIAKPAVLAPKMTDDQAITVLDSLLNNVYRSFDFRKEEDVYNRLATSVQGNLLTEIYLQNRRSMVVTQAGGARARVNQVDILDVEVRSLADSPLGLLFHADWTATGSVGHWGHIHTRQNQYKANIAVRPVDGAWKITALELLEEKRIDPYANPEKSAN